MSNKLTRQDIYREMQEIEHTLPDAIEYVEWFNELLDQYYVCVLALKSINDTYPWERLIDITERMKETEQRLPNVSDEEFNVYCVQMGLLGPLSEM